MGSRLVCLSRREDRRSPAIFDRKELTHLGALTIVRPQAVLHGAPFTGVQV